MIVQSVRFVSSSISASVPAGITNDLDASVRADLAHISDTFFFWVAVGAIVVAIGCILEGPEVLHEIFPNLFSWFTWPSKDRLDKFERTIKKVGLIGWLLVVLGVAAEGVFEVYDHQAGGLLQTFDELLLTTTQRETALAQLETAMLRRDTQALKTDADTQRAIAGTALQKAGEANNTAEKEKLDETQLELLVSPRRLTLDQQGKIGHACVWVKPVIVSSYALDSEGRVLALEIIQSLKSGEISVRSNIGYTLDTGDLDAGVLISGPTEADSFTACLGNALRTIGKLDVVVNGEQHKGTAIEGTEFGASFNCTNCRMEFDRSRSIRGGPTGPGTPVIVKVGVRPDAVDPNVRTP
ncbi:MAG TPA: hypothetical protein VGU46_08190 [Acidobacteriaceae bacterium]|nr:hypothetical protein [Acidobacteriaceae bacterium]